MNTRAYWASFNLGIELRLRKDDVLTGSHQGACDDDIAHLLAIPRIKKQLDAIPPEKIARELAEWSDWDTSDQEANRARLLWIACSNIREEKRW